MTLEELLDNKYQNNSLVVNNKYNLYVERLEPVDGEEDILLEVFDNGGNFLFNTLDYLTHCFKSDSVVRDVLVYANEAIRLYEKEQQQ